MTDDRIPNVTLHAHCVRCGGGVELFCLIDDNLDLAHERWHCPYCSAENEIGLGGEIFSVVPTPIEPGQAKDRRDT